MDYASLDPRTRARDPCSFLWNQLVSGEPVVLGLDVCRNPVVKVKEQVLNAAFRTTLTKRTEPSPSPTCTLVGTVLVCPENDGMVVLLDQLPSNAALPTGPGIVRIPCKFSKANHGDSTGELTKEDRLTKVTSYSEAWSYAPLECGLDLGLALRLELSARTRGPTCDLTVEAVTPAVPLRLVPLFPVPMLRSGVQDALSSSHACPPDFGFVTLCGGRLCLHFKHQLEDTGFDFVGVWVSGVGSIHHPYIWLVCAQFLTSRKSFSRPPEIFVVIVLPSTSSEAPDAEEGALFYNCLHPPAFSSLRFQLWQGHSTTTVARVPSATNKTIGIPLEKVTSGKAAEGFQWALMELSKNRSIMQESSATELQRNDSAGPTQHSWVPTPAPTRGEMLHVSPTVPEVSDYSAGAGQHSEFENWFPGANAVGQTCLSHRTTVPVPSPTTQAPGTLVQSPAGAVGAGFGSWLPPGNVGLQKSEVAMGMGVCRTPENASQGATLAPEVYELIRRQDEQLQELRIQIQRMMSPGGVAMQSDNLGNGSKMDACTMTTGTSASCPVWVNRSTQTDGDSMALQRSHKDLPCSFCGRCPTSNKQPLVPNGAADPNWGEDDLGGYTIFFPEKSPHLAHRGTTKGGALDRIERGANRMGSPSYQHENILKSSSHSVSFINDIRKAQAPGDIGTRPTSAETFLHPRLEYQTLHLGDRHHEREDNPDLSFQVDQIAHKYCPNGAISSVWKEPKHSVVDTRSPALRRVLHGEVQRGVPRNPATADGLSFASKEYLRNYGLLGADLPERGPPRAQHDLEPSERILDISALKKLPKLL